MGKISNVVAALFFIVVNRNEWSATKSILVGKAIATAAKLHLLG